MNPKRYAGKLTIEAALEIVRQILRDNAPGSCNTLEGSLGPPTSERCQALRRLGQVAADRVAADRVAADRKKAAKRKETARERTP